MLVGLYFLSGFLTLVGTDLDGLFGAAASQRMPWAVWCQMVIGEHLGNIYHNMVLWTISNAFNLLLIVLFMSITLLFVYKDGSYTNKRAV